MSAQEPYKVATLGQEITIGRIVHYRVSETDAKHINGFYEYGGRRGNLAKAGDVYPAMIVAVWGDPQDSQTVVNLQVFVDADFPYWTSSVHQEVELGQVGVWFWPPRIKFDPPQS